MVDFQFFFFRDIGFRTHQQIIFILDTRSTHLTFCSYKKIALYEGRRIFCGASLGVISQYNNFDVLLCRIEEFLRVMKSWFN